MMLTTILVVLILLWFLGYGPLLDFRFPLFPFGPNFITLWDILIFLMIIWLIDLLPGPLRSIAAVILVLWLLATFGIIAVPLFSNLIVIGVIVGLAIYILNSN